MPATNFILAVYQQILALLGANVRVAAALKAGNTVREDQGKFQPRDARGAKNAVDFPRVYLRQRGFELVAGSQSPDGEELGVFAEEATGFTPSTGDWEEKIGQPFDVKIVHDGLDLAAASAFELDVVEALRDGGTKLGLDYVIGWSYAAQSIETDRDADAPGRMRRVTTITLTVQTHLHGSELAFHSPAGAWVSNLDGKAATIAVFSTPAPTNGVYAATVTFTGMSGAIVGGAADGTWDSATDALSFTDDSSHTIGGSWNRATGTIGWGSGWLFTNQVEAPLS